MLIRTLILRTGLRTALERALRAALGTACLLTGLVHLLKGFVEGLGVLVNIGKVLSLNGFLEGVAVGLYLILNNRSPSGIFRPGR